MLTQAKRIPDDISLQKPFQSRRRDLAPIVSCKDKGIHSRYKVSSTRFVWYSLVRLWFLHLPVSFMCPLEPRTFSGAVVNVNASWENGARCCPCIRWPDPVDFARGAVERSNCMIVWQRFKDLKGPARWRVLIVKGKTFTVLERVIGGEKWWAVASLEVQSSVVKTELRASCLASYEKESIVSTDCQSKTHRASQVLPLDASARVIPRFSTRP